jgi:SynChlorMet cassette radical SAM/SPASM protein ScmF
MDNADVAAQDNTRRSLNTIYFYLADGCNLRCRHCWIEPDFQPDGKSCHFLPLETFKSIITQAKPLGLSSVKLTGGEPLLHPEIGGILDFLRSEDLRMNMETNGTLCTPELARKIASCKNAFASVSFDGADAETHEWMRGVDGCFDDAVAGLKNLVAAGIKPQVIMTITRRNYRQMEAIVRLAERLGAVSVKFNILQPTARGKLMHEAGEALTLEELLKIGTWAERELSRSTKLKVYFSHPPAFRPLSRMYGRTGGGCGVCGILGIIGVLADGSYAMCGIGETIPELIFGHAAKDRLADVWAKTPVINELRHGLPEQLAGICGDCVMKNTCRGNCIAQNYANSRNLWAPYWFCDEARKKGLFPDSRVLAKCPEIAVLSRRP